MNLIEVFESICQQMENPPSFSYKSKHEHNASDHLDYSNAHINLIEIDQPGFKFVRGSGGIKDRFPVFIEFIRKSKQDLTAEQRNVIVSEMRMLAAEFILRLDATDLFEEFQENIPGVEVVDRYDNNVAGVEVNLVLVSSEPYNICL